MAIKLLSVAVASDLEHIISWLDIACLEYFEKLPTTGCSIQHLFRDRSVFPTQKRQMEEFCWTTDKSPDLKFSFRRNSNMDVLKQL